MMKKFKNNRQYPKNYVRALAKQAREELDEFKKKEERFHLGVLSRISAEDDRQNDCPSRAFPQGGLRRHLCSERAGRQDYH